MARARHQDGTRGRVAICLLAALAATLVMVTPVSAAGSGPQSVQVTVKPATTYNNTGVAVKSGDSVTVTAAGRMHFGGGKIAGLTPAGIPWGTACDAIASNLARNAPWPAPGASCWALIGKIGLAGAPIEIGLSRTFVADASGNLFLGVNDNFVNDNSGSWAATVTVTPPNTPTSAPTPTTTAAASGSGGESKSSSSTMPILIGAAVLVLLLLFLVLFLARRRRKPVESVPEDDEPFVPDLPLAPNPYAAVAASAVVTPPPAPEPVVEPEPVVAPWSAPPDAESIDVNIFEVEFNNGLTLRVGYNHFPEGTDLRWKVTQNRIPVATGHFVTKGGGSTNHLETVPLGVKLEGRDAQPDGADVQFDWAINGVPFRYSVRRDPNC